MAQIFKKRSLGWLPFFWGGLLWAGHQNQGEHFFRTLGLHSDRTAGLINLGCLEKMKSMVTTPVIGIITTVTHEAGYFFVGVLALGWQYCYILTGAGSSNLKTIGVLDTSIFSRTRGTTTKLTYQSPKFLFEKQTPPFLGGFLHLHPPTSLYGNFQKWNPCNLPMYSNGILLRRLLQRCAKLECFSWYCCFKVWNTPGISA